MFDSLTRYLPELSKSESYGEWIVDNEHAGTKEDPIQFPFVGYGRLVIDVEEAIYAFVDEHPELRRYSEILEKNGLEWGMDSMVAADVSELDGEAVMALLLGAVRAERFCDGALLDFFEQGCVKRWIARLAEIDGAEGSSVSFRPSKTPSPTASVPCRPSK